MSPSLALSCSPSWTAGTGEGTSVVATTKQRASRRFRAAVTSPASSRSIFRGKSAKSRRRGGRSRPRQQVVQRRRIAVLGVLTVIALGYLLWFTPFLGVSTVEVVGVREVEADRVRSVADVPIDHPMVRVDTDRVAARVSELPGVAEADVSRSWPSTITITVTERRAVAYHESSGGVELVDSTGVLFEHLDAPPDGLPKLDLLDQIGRAHV